MPESNNPAPHACGDCGEPAYHGFNMKGVCVQKGCPFYDESLWLEWVMWLPDVEDPEPDPFEDEETEPNFFLTRSLGAPFASIGYVDPHATDAQLDAVGQLLGLTRLPDETDVDYRNRLMDFYRKAP